MFSGKNESVKDIIKSVFPEDKELEKELKDKSDEEIIKLVKQDLENTNSTIIDRVNMQKTGARSTSSDPFVRGLSFYLFSVLDDTEFQGKFLSDLKKLEQIKPLKAVIESVQNHIEEYKECAKNPRPPLQGPVSGRG